ncbi:MAG: hypothetical protein JXD18_08660, partial [Anaerolineae bacterium]|nr:hypothetical protein [Anaerolineae bacterium]
MSHADEPLVQHLLTHTERPAIRNWHWWEHVGEETFLVTLSGGVPVGVLMACRDAGPVAWVRIAALASHVAVGEWLDLCLPRLIPPLRRQGTRRLGWLDVGGWAGAALRARWFQRETWLVTLGKGDHHLPHATAQDAHV